MAKRLVAGKEFVKWLENAGIIPERTSRVVIDAACDDVIHIYVAMHADESLISVKPPFAQNVEVRVIGSMAERPVSKLYRTGQRIDDEWFETIEESARESD